MGAFVGHDHVNDLGGELFGVRLCCDRARGFASYGRDGVAHGARVIRLREATAAFQPWLRLEDGTRE